MLVPFSWSHFKAVYTYGNTGQVSPAISYQAPGLVFFKLNKSSMAGREQTSPCVAGCHCQFLQGPMECSRRALSCPDPNPGLMLSHGLRITTHCLAQLGHASSTTLLCQKARAPTLESSHPRAAYHPSTTNKELNAVDQQASSLCYRRTAKCIITPPLPVPEALPTHQRGLTRGRCRVTRCSLTRAGPVQRCTETRCSPFPRYARFGSEIAVGFA